MKNLSNDRAAGDAAGADSTAQLNDHPQLSVDVHWDLQIAGMLRKNVLLVGDERTVRLALEALWLDVNEPALSWRPGQTLDLPFGGGARTLVLHNVGELSGDEQTHILRWFDESTGRIRIVSTNTEPLWPRVMSGAFSETLYYRLNTVHVDVSGHAMFGQMNTLKAC